jgi:hypothetical protein
MDTREHLYPKAGLQACGRCRVRFSPRQATHQEDDPKLCLACNRRGWSVLFGFSVKRQGNVVSMKRGRR